MRLAPWLFFAVLLAIGLLVLGSAIFPGYIFLCQETIQRLPPRCVKLDKDPVRHKWISGAKEFNCWEVQYSLGTCLAVLCNRKGGVSAWEVP